MILSPTTISIAALVISSISLVISAYFGARDRYKLATSSNFHPIDEHGPAQMTIKVVNVGRRLVILKLFGGHDNEGHWSGEILGNDGKGLYLKENEVFERTIHWDDLQIMDPYSDSISSYKTLWVEDTRGHRHKIRKSRQNIRKLLESK